MDTITPTMGMLAYRLAEIGDPEGMAGVVGKMTADERMMFTLAVQFLAEAIEQSSPDTDEDDAEADECEAVTCEECTATTRTPNADGWGVIVQPSPATTFVLTYCPEHDPKPVGGRARPF